MTRYEIVCISSPNDLDLDYYSMKITSNLIFDAGNGLSSSKYIYLDTKNVIIGQLVVDICYILCSGSAGGGHLGFASI